jgi:hypothetical protein
MITHSLVEEDEFRDATKQSTVERISSKVIEKKILLFSFKTLLNRSSIKYVTGPTPGGVVHRPLSSRTTPQPPFSKGLLAQLCKPRARSLAAYEVSREIEVCCPPR